MSRREKTKWSNTISRAYSSYGRIVKWVDPEAAAVCVASVRDTETQEASLVAQFADALHPAAMPWDVFIEGPMPERASMSIRQPLLRNGFGSKSQFQR